MPPARGQDGPAADCPAAPVRRSRCDVRVEDSACPAEEGPGGLRQRQVFRLRLGGHRRASRFSSLATNGMVGLRSVDGGDQLAHRVHLFGPRHDDLVGSCLLRPHADQGALSLCRCLGMDCVVELGARRLGHPPGATAVDAAVHCTAARADGGRIVSRQVLVAERLVSVAIAECFRRRQNVGFLVPVRDLGLPAQGAPRVQCHRRFGCNVPPHILVFRWTAAGPTDVDILDYH